MSALKRVVSHLAFAATIACVFPAIAQQPTDEQRNAIRSACRSDYEANCASVPPGGAASLQCLQKNMSKLSGACKQAVTAIEPAASPPKAETTTTAPAAPAPAKPAAAAAAPKAAAAGQKPTDAQAAAIRSACRSDYQKNCASVPPGGAASLQCLQKSMPKLSSGCQKAVSAVGGGTAAPAAATAAAPAADAPAAAPLVLRPMRPREEMFVLRSACGADVRTLCGGVAPGGGRIVQCLAVRAASLSPACKDVLAQFAAQ
ncbi:hypothetical protein [Afipia clevelandensis]|uniref:Cysteine rich repeat protein n=1 Tax=Afipia clevelandensis ATCC 49720 TaxID=883079 RepID=K8PSH6_9BRAD|nr:hypothetical protein [Afipia clevelandensis]EKS42490.1 hypothetical protein HMPREF9696_00033 [Afipia clevelandensis ATCC 49720]